MESKTQFMSETDGFIIGTQCGFYLHVVCKMDVGTQLNGPLVYRDVVVCVQI